MTEGLHFTQEELEAINDALDIAFGEGDHELHTLQGVDRLRKKLNDYAHGKRMTLREELRKHQEATDCSDDRMVEILCGFIEKLDNDGQLEGPWYEWLFEWVADELFQPPGDLS